LINQNSSNRDNAVSDEMLVAKSKNGDKAAFEILVKRYSKYVYTTAFFMIRDSHEAEDISQEVFVKVYLSIGGFRGLSSFKTWLRKLTVNTCIDKIRLKSKTSDKKVSLDSMIEDGKEILLYEFNQNVEKFFQDKETVNEVLKIVVNLDESYRIPLILRDLQDYSYIEIAEILKKPVGTVKTNIHRARKIIKDLLIEK
jgi:RNA polymerase sigma-70 factor, ECF subfamily